LDEPSLQALDFALRRLSGADVLVLAALRPVPPPLESAFSEEARDHLVLGPLSVGAIGRLVRDRLGALLPRRVATRLHEETAGNPFYALELARAVLAQGNLPGPGEPFPVPVGLASLVAGRLSGLSAEELELLFAIASLARPAR